MPPVVDALSLAIIPRNPFTELRLLVPGILVVGYALVRHKLTVLGGLTATATALLHIAFPSDVPFTALIVFFLVGTFVTRVGKRAKAGLTVSATGGGGAEGPRNAAQVLANSGTASLFVLLTLLSVYTKYKPMAILSKSRASSNNDLVRSIVFGITCSYAAASADTCSSELGILAQGSPFMITPPFRQVSRGTNGGVTILGLAAGLGGSSILAALHFAAYRDVIEAVSVAVLGLSGSILDSVLGALVQATVEDKKSGRVVEGANGRRVMVTKQGSRVQRGLDLLNNNGVNFAMTLSIGLLGLFFNAVS